MKHATRWSRRWSGGLVCALWLAALVGVIQLPEAPQGSFAVPTSSSTQELSHLLELGVNRIRVPWDGTQDAAALELRCVRAPGDVEFLGMELKRGEREIVWRVFSSQAGEAKFLLSM